MNRVFCTVTLCILASVIGGCGKKATTKVSIKNKGSDTLVQVAQAWAEAYGETNQDVSVQVSGGGSGTGITALINGTVDIANASRAIKDKEREEIKEKLGKEVNEYIVGFDGIAVYTHKDNPLTNISLEALNGIYAEGGSIGDWKDVGAGELTGEIQRASRQNNSGTYAFFRDVVCGKGGEFKQGANSLSGSKEVVEFVTTTPLAIGYSGMGYKNDEVNWLAVSKEAGAEAFEPTPENVLSKDYPIARPLYLYTVGEESPEVKAYIKWIMGAAGQEVVASQKFVPLQ
ncbi:MAG: phosphate ABC transporter substrate-binding protein [Planctomycetota bacterium]